MNLTQTLDDTSGQAQKVNATFRLDNSNGFSSIGRAQVSGEKRKINANASRNKWPLVRRRESCQGVERVARSLFFTILFSHCVSDLFFSCFRVTFFPNNSTTPHFYRELAFYYFNLIFFNGAVPKKKVKNKKQNNNNKRQRAFSLAFSLSSTEKRRTFNESDADAPPPETCVRPVASRARAHVAFGAWASGSRAPDFQARQRNDRMSAINAPPPRSSRAPSARNEINTE